MAEFISGKALRMKSRKGDFKPDRAFVEKAVEQYLASGGKITKIERQDILERDSSTGSLSFMTDLTNQVAVTVRPRVTSLLKLLEYM